MLGTKAKVLLGSERMECGFSCAVWMSVGSLPATPSVMEKNCGLAGPVVGGEEKASRCVGGDVNGIVDDRSHASDGQPRRFWMHQKASDACCRVSCHAVRAKRESAIRQAKDRPTEGGTWSRGVRRSAMTLAKSKSSGSYEKHAMSASVCNQLNLAFPLALVPCVV